MDTTYLEYTAEDLIAHKLQRGGLLVAKPKFDRDGTDLIALMEVADGAKFCRIQCKGRALINCNNSNVRIPKEYVTGAFFVFLYVDTGGSEPHIFCFSAEEIIRFWELKIDPKLQKQIYYLGISKGSFLNSNKESNLLVLRPRSSDMFSGCLYSVKSRFLLSHISIHTLLILQNMYVENGFNAIPFLQIPNRH